MHCADANEETVQGIVHLTINFIYHFFGQLMEIERNGTVSIWQ